MLPKLSSLSRQHCGVSIIFDKPQWFPFPNDNSSQDLPQLFLAFHCLPVVAEPKRPQTLMVKSRLEFSTP